MLKNADNFETLILDEQKEVIYKLTNTCEIFIDDEKCIECKASLQKGLRAPAVRCELAMRHLRNACFLKWTACPITT